MWGVGGVLQMMMDDAESEGMSSFREGGRGQTKDDTGLCGGM